jgi:hypothetical protein
MTGLNALTTIGGVNGDQLGTIDPQLCDEPLAPVVSKLTYPMYAQTTDVQQQTFNDPTPMLPGEQDLSHGWRRQPQLHTAPAFALNVDPVYPLIRDPILDPPLIPFPITNTPPEEVVQLKRVLDGLAHIHRRIPTRRRSLAVARRAVKIATRVLPKARRPS